MATAIDTLNGSTGPMASAASATKSTVNPKSQLKVEDFIKMMVTQLQNQDPMEPAKNEQLLAQMSQIGQLQSQQALQTSMTSLVLQNNIGSASNLIGKTVEGLDGASGATISGKVKSVRVEKGNVVLELEEGLKLPMSQVSQIEQPNADLADAVTKSAGATVGAGT